MSNITLATMCAFAFSSLSAQDVSSTDFQKQIMSISVDTSIMRALTSVGNDRRIAIGILLGTGSPHQLCEVKRQVTIRDRPISEFMDELLTKSNYVWSVTDGVIVVRPSHITNQLNRLRNLKFDRFGGMQTTMQGLGITLSAWIHSRLYPKAQGYAVDILSSPDADKFPQLEVRDLSVEQIPNKIVSLGSKGMWLCHLDSDFEHNRNVDLRTYSYKDDAIVLLSICGTINT